MTNHNKPALSQMLIQLNITNDTAPYKIYEACDYVRQINMAASDASIIIFNHLAAFNIVPGDVDIEDLILRHLAIEDNHELRDELLLEQNYQRQKFVEGGGYELVPGFWRAVARMERENRANATTGGLDETMKSSANNPGAKALLQHNQEKYND